tara:strand:- start:839 stop:1384 length:546 start_codon:yes stop_codon:yes gene_type:complete
MNKKSNKNIHALKVDYKNRAELIPYVNNARTHSEEQIKQVAASIKEFGFTNPILIDENNGIIAGHGRSLAAELLNMDEVPTITLTGLTDNQRKAYILADNKLALNAGWDEDLVRIELQELNDFDFDATLTGFTNDELDAMFNIDFEPATEDEQGQLDELDPKIVECPNCKKPFDLRSLDEK